ncbi:MAG: hypothetical protein ACQXXE_00775 [Candidatus Bathyarchaeia archaeon]|nr:hypothetical protein [Candidatus Bathyarchaeota archaeon A05DMB-5]
MMKARVAAILVVLAFLSLIVIAYNFRFHNIPYLVYLNAHKLSEWEIPPPAYTDLTQSDFSGTPYEYVQACDIVREPIKISKATRAYDWFQQYFNYSQGHDTIKYYGDYYYIQIAYFPEVERTLGEHVLLWTINIGAVVAWAIFAYTFYLTCKRTSPKNRGM